MNIWDRIDEMSPLWWALAMIGFTAAAMVGFALALHFLLGLIP